MAAYFCTSTRSPKGLKIIFHSRNQETTGSLTWKHQNTGKNIYSAHCSQYRVPAPVCECVCVWLIHGLSKVRQTGAALINPPSCNNRDLQVQRNHKHRRWAARCPQRRLELSGEGVAACVCDRQLCTWTCVCVRQVCSRASSAGEERRVSLLAIGLSGH